ncbi:hypothetical protein D3C79_789140 [compost metagenome]
MIGTGVLGQVPHQGFDQALQQHFFGQCARGLEADFQVQSGLAGRAVGLLHGLSAQEGVQGFELAYLARGAPDVEAVAGYTQVQVGTGDQPAGDAHFGQLLVGEGLLMDEPGGRSCDLGLVEAADGG